MYTFPPIFIQFTFFWLHLRFLLPPILTMMHLCIMLYAYCTPPDDNTTCKHSVTSCLLPLVKLCEQVVIWPVWLFKVIGLCRVVMIAIASENLKTDLHKCCYGSFKVTLLFSVALLCTMFIPLCIKLLNLYV